MLMGDRLKYISLIFGIAFSTLLIAQQGSIFYGLMYNTGASVRAITGPFDLWVMDAEVEQSEDSKPLPDTALDRVRSIEGVDWAVPIYRGRLRCRLPDGRLITCVVIGIDDASLIGAPPLIKSGNLSDLRRDQAIMVEEQELDRNLLLKNAPPGMPKRLQIGDAVDINDNQAIITGTFDIGARKFFWEPMIYTTFNRALTFAPRERKLTTYVLAKVKPGYDQAQVAARIKNETGMKALSSPQFQELTKNYILNNTGILINFSISMTLGFIIGILMAGQTLYNFTLDNLRYFATLKALGATNFRLVKIVGLQVLVVGFIGYGIGLGCAAMFGTVMKGTRLAFYMIWQIPVYAAIAISLICLLAGIISLWKVLRLEPAVVFK